MSFGYLLEDKGNVSALFLKHGLRVPSHPFFASFWVVLLGVVFGFYLIEPRNVFSTNYQQMQEQKFWFASTTMQALNAIIVFYFYYYYRYKTLPPFLAAFMFSIVLILIVKRTTLVGVWLIILFMHKVKVSVASIALVVILALLLVAVGEFRFGQGYFFEKIPFKPAWRVLTTICRDYRDG